MSKRKRRRTRLQAGIFMAVGLAVLAGAILLIGQKDALFVPTRTFYVYYGDASGLVPGAPVRLAGVDVGVVTAISIPDDNDVSGARISLVVQERFANRVREDSMAFIDSKGLLGDKVINLTLGDPEKPQLKDGATLTAGQTMSFESLSRDVHSALEAVTEVAREAKTLIVGLQGEEVAGSLGRVIGEIEQGDGVIHRLVYDRELADNIDTLVAETRVSASRVRSAMTRVDNVLAEVEHGDGTLHDIVYGDSGKDALAELQVAAAEIGTVTREIREGDGLLHTLVYDQGNTDFLRELTEFSATLNRMAKQMEKGRGTLGALAVDPTVYEDMKTVLGNIERNTLLKALIRFTIKNDDVRQMGSPPPRAAEAQAEVER